MDIKKKLIPVLALSFIPVFSVPAQAAYESEGFDRPEEAVLAYIDAFDHGDVEGMISTFAVESYVDHVDPEEYLALTRNFNQGNTWSAIPDAGDYTRSVKIAKRCAELQDGLLNQYLYFSGASFMPVAFGESSEMQAFLSDMEDSFAAKWQGNVEFVDWIDVTRSEKLNANILANMTRQAVYSGGEDFSALAAHIRLNGSDAVQFMDCIRYNGRWYNWKQVSFLSMVCNMPPQACGLYCPDVQDLCDPSLAAPNLNNNIETLLEGGSDGEARAMLEANAESGLPGTTMILRAVDNGEMDIRIASGVEDIRSSQDCALYGELCFMTGGACLRIWATPAAGDLGIHTRDVDEVYRSNFFWTLQDGAFTVSDENCTLVMSGDSIFIQDYNILDDAVMTFSAAPDSENAAGNRAEGGSDAQPDSISEKESDAPQEDPGEDTDFTFRDGITWGLDTMSVLAADGIGIRTSPYDETGDMSIYPGSDMIFGGLGAEVIYLFKNDLLSVVTIGFPEYDDGDETVEQVRAVLEEEYGEPNYEDYDHIMEVARYISNNNVDTGENFDKALKYAWLLPDERTLIFTANLPDAGGPGLMYLDQGVMPSSATP